MDKYGSPVICWDEQGEMIKVHKSDKKVWEFGVVYYVCRRKPFSDYNDKLIKPDNINSALSIFQVGTKMGKVIICQTLRFNI